MEPQALVYKETPQGVLQLHYFAAAGKGGDSAGMVFFFGGGWRNGTPTQFFPQCRELAALGVACFAAEYRIGNSHGTSPDACVADGKSAVRWIRSHAAEFGVDPSRLGAGGGSAGGHVAAATAMSPGFDAGAAASTSARPDALVLFNPVLDAGPDGFGFDRTEPWFPAISPAHNIVAGLPPTIMFLGTEDRLVSVAAAEDIAARMRAVGNRFELHLYEGATHGFFNYHADGNPYYRQTTDTAIAFLRELGWLRA